MHVDSQCALHYLHGFEPTEVSGTRLLPLIELARIEQQRHPNARALNISINVNKAHAPALATAVAATRGANGRSCYGCIGWCTYGDNSCFVNNIVYASPC